MISGIGVFYPDKKPTQRMPLVIDWAMSRSRVGSFEAA
jgi:hypothetical protein